MRINQFVAASSGLSRRAADAAIQAGRVKVNGHIATLGETVTDNIQVMLDDKHLSLPARHTYLALNKPEGYVSSRARQGSDPTLYELLPPEYHQLRPAGRLDRDSSGLMLLSDDGEFINRLTHPSFGKEKTYELTLSRPFNPPDQGRLEHGVQLTDGPSRLKVLAHKGTRITVSISEGRNRQLRRTFGALGYSVRRLHRTQIGPYHLGDLPAGSWREVTAQ